MGVARARGRKGQRRAPWRPALMLLLLIGWALPAAADEGPVDLNADGSISLAEFIAGWQHEFARRDENGDGMLSVLELLRGSASNAELVERFASHDADSDGNVDAEEFEQLLTSEFSDFDLDGDELLDRFELFQASAPDDSRLTSEELELMDGQVDTLQAELAALGVHEGGELSDGAISALHSWLRAAVAPKMVQLSIVRILAEQAALEAKECIGSGHDAYERSVARFAAGDFSRDELHLVELHAQRTAHGLLAARMVPGRMASFVKLFIAAALVRMSTRALDARRIAEETRLDLEACADAGMLR